MLSGIKYFCCSVVMVFPGVLFDLENDSSFLSVHFLYHLFPQNSLKIMTKRNYRLSNPWDIKVNKIAIDANAIAIIIPPQISISPLPHRSSNAMFVRPLCRRYMEEPCWACILFIWYQSEELHLDRPIQLVQIQVVHHNWWYWSHSTKQILENSCQSIISFDIT